MKKIALLTDGWKRYVTYAWVHGITERAKELGADICLYTFNTNGNLSQDEKHNEGEYALFEIVDYNAFDGFIYDCSNTSNPEVIRSIVQKLKSVSAPVVCINYHVDGFYYVGNDNRNLIRSMVDHMVEVHDCQELVFAGGPADNYENKERLAGFREAAEEHGLTLHANSVLFGDYDYDTGVRYMKEWLDDGLELPDAFICANDNIAAGLCAEAELRGYRIPDDFRVTGFDNLDKAAYYKPQIASVDHNRGRTGGCAFDVLLALMAGEEVPEHTYMSSRIVPAESCGCPNTGKIDYRDYAKWQIDADVGRDRHEKQILELEKLFTDCRTMEGLFDSFADYVRSLRCNGVFICADRQIFEASPENRLPEDKYDINNLTVIVGWDHDKRLYGIRELQDLMAYLDKSETSRSCMFFPIHFRNRRVGMTVLLEPLFLYDNPFFYDVHHTFINRMHNLYSQTLLANAADRMKKLYNRDALTNLYNRITCDEMIAPRFMRSTRDGITSAITFFDVDRFKLINDTYGHDLGDRVLVTIARTITADKPLDAFAYRFGGDEFVVFIPYASEDKVNRFVSRVESELKKRHIDVSTGIIYTDPDKEITLDQYLTMADQHMYEVKRAHKQDMEGKALIQPDVESAFETLDFIKGMDLSSLPEKEDRGAVFRDMDGTPVDPFALIKKYGVNSVRLRLWNEPKNHPESGGYCDLTHTLKMAERIKRQNLHFLLDFHYSDYWADPGQQRKPAAWKDYDTNRLTDAVYDYTRDVLIALSKIDALPDMVQIGNEIRSGMLFPDGETPNYTTLAALVNAGIRAVRSVSEDIKVMIHLDQGGRFFYLSEWFNAMFAAGMKPIDAIGISYYSFWHGTFQDLKDTMEQLGTRYRLPVYIVETAHPWRHCEGEHIAKDMMNMAGFEAGTEEQKKSLSLVMQIAAEASRGRKTGVYYWEPLSIAGSGFGSWDENMGMLGEEAKALPAFEAFRDFDPKQLPYPETKEFIASLYRKKAEAFPPAGTNLIGNPDFENGVKGWWVNGSSDEVEYRAENGELYVSSPSNFTFCVCRDLRIGMAGTYRLSVDYRGSNTTGVSVMMYIKVINCNGEEKYERPIYPSDVDFETWSMEGLKLEAGGIQVGLYIEAPPVYARIRHFSLTAE